MQLSEQQQQIIDWDHGNAVVIAGAGSGKTRSLIERTEKLIEKGYSPNRILLFTFTRKAATEIISRLVKKLGEPAESVEASTIHSLALKIFREHFAVLDYETQPTIWTPDRIGRMTAEIIKNRIKEECDQRPTKETKELFGDSDKQKLFRINIKPRIDQILTDLAPPIPTKISGLGLEAYRNKVIKILEEDFLTLPLSREIIADSCTRILQTKIACNVITFSDMIPAAIAILERDPENPYHSSYDHVMVDEYQDVNSTNVSFVRVLSHNAISLMAVGDDDQAIYGFRGGNTEHILNFPKLFNGTTLYLTTNYRSQPEIIHLANELISENQGRFGKTMTPNKEPSTDPDIIQIIAPTGYDKDFSYGLSEQEKRLMQRLMYQKIISEIRALVFFLEVPPTEIAILARNNFNLVQFSNVARREQLEMTKKFNNNDHLHFQMLSNLNLFSNTYIKRIHNWFNVFLNPEDKVSLREALMDSVPGFGDKSSLLLDDAVFNDPEGNLSQWLDYVLTQPRHGIKTKKGKELLRVQKLYTQITESLNKMNPLEIYFACFELAQIKSEINRKRAENKSGKEMDRMDSLEALLCDYREFLSEKTFECDLYGSEGLRNWMDMVHVELSETETVQHITLGTIHSSKGKEWKYVFIVDLQSDILPSKRADDIEEERRLLYVGFTRAEEYLYLSWFDEENISPFIHQLHNHLPEKRKW